MYSYPFHALHLMIMVANEKKSSDNFPPTYLFRIELVIQTTCVRHLLYQEVNQWYGQCVKTVKVKSEWK